MAFCEELAGYKVSNIVRQNTGENSLQCKLEITSVKYKNRQFTSRAPPVQLEREGRNTQTFRASPHPLVLSVGTSRCIGGQYIMLATLTMFDQMLRQCRLV